MERKKKKKEKKNQNMILKINISSTFNQNFHNFFVGSKFGSNKVKSGVLILQQKKSFKKRNKIKLSLNTTIFSYHIKRTNSLSITKKKNKIKPPQHTSYQNNLIIYQNKTKWEETKKYKREIKTWSWRSVLILCLIKIFTIFLKPFPTTKWKGVYWFFKQK